MVDGESTTGNWNEKFREREKGATEFGAQRPITKTLTTIVFPSFRDDTLASIPFPDLIIGDAMRRASRLFERPLDRSIYFINTTTTTREGCDHALPLNDGLPILYSAH
jgi:hypothetical protein